MCVLFKFVLSLEEEKNHNFTDVNVCVLLLLVQMLNSEISFGKIAKEFCSADRQSKRKRRKKDEKTTSKSVRSAARLPNCGSEIAENFGSSSFSSSFNVVRFALRLRDRVFCQNFLRLCTLFFVRY